MKSSGPGSSATAPVSSWSTLSVVCGRDGAERQEQGQQEQRREEPHEVGGPADPCAAEAARRPRHRPARGAREARRPRSHRQSRADRAMAAAVARCRARSRMRGRTSVAADRRTGQDAVVLPTPVRRAGARPGGPDPSGQVVTYGDVAGAVGGSALSVGRVMSRFGSGVPWWRVIKAGGLLPPGHEVEAARRLAAERVPFREPRVGSTSPGAAGPPIRCPNRPGERSSGVGAVWFADRHECTRGEVRGAVPAGPRGRAGGGARHASTRPSRPSSIASRRPVTGRCSSSPGRARARRRRWSRQWPRASRRAHRPSASSR